MAERRAVLLSGEDVRGIVSMSGVVDAVREAYVDWGEDRRLNYLCHRNRTPADVRVCVHQGASPAAGATGLLVHCEHVAPDVGSERYLHVAPPISVLFGAADGRLAGLIIGEPTCTELPDVPAVAGLRTAATSAVGTDALARRDARVLGLIGAGKQAAVHVAALSAVRSFERIVVFSRDQARREAFMARMSSLTGLSVGGVGTAEEAVRSADIVLTATNSSTPVIDGSWLASGQHVTSIVGGMVGLHRVRPSGPGRRELDDVTDERADLIGLASREQAVYGFEEVDSEDLVEAYISAQRAYLHWPKTVELSDVLVGRHPGRTSAEEITVFKNNAGQGIADVAVGMLVLERAVATGRGRTLP